MRHELIVLARAQDPIDNIVKFVEENYARPPRPEIDHHATVLADTYDLPADVWDTLCRRAAASGIPVSDYVRNELVSLSRRPTIDDVMWEFGEAQAADPSLGVDLDAVLQATRYARGLD